MAEFLAGLLEHRIPQLYGLVIGRPIIAVVPWGKLARLDIAAGLAASVGLAEQRWPVLDGAGEESDMYEIERVVWPGPPLGRIVDLEFDVGRHPDWLLVGISSSSIGNTSSVEESTCIGDRSVPITSTLGCSSPKSLSKVLL